MVGEVLMLRLFSVHVHDAAVRVCLQSLGTRSHPLSSQSMVLPPCSTPWFPRWQSLLHLTKKLCVRYHMNQMPSLARA
jgi:hypothetical protein